MYRVSPGNGQISVKCHMNITSDVLTAVIAHTAVIWVVLLTGTKFETEQGP
jgi:hypothetical protein